ncbi:Solute carrier family 22 member 20 [Echinococcus granulosus]|nr:Solute carrier family 22 member 20 [Echinococcus granulosus]
MSGINFDLLLEEIGGFGRFQKLAIASLSTVQIFLAFANFGFVFFGHAPTEFHCVEPPYNVTGCQPLCRRYESEDGYFSYTIEWQLICHSNYLLRLAQIAHMAGLFFGAFTCGALADRFGRLRVLYISLGIMCILSFMTIWITNISSFCVVTFLLGICCQGCGLTSYTIILETVDEKHRALCGILEQIFYAFGIALTALLAYYFLDWRNLAKVFATCGPIAFVCMLPFHIESTRWLLVQPNRRAAALKNLNYIARINGTLGSTKLNGLGDGSRITSLLKSLSHEGLRATENVGLVKDTEPLIDNVDKKVVVKQRSIQREGCCTLCLHPLLRKWMLIFSVSWFSNAAAYYGSTIASGEAFTNRFLSFALSGLIEIPGHCLSPRLMNTCGRRKFHSYLQILGGTFFLLVPLMGSWHEAAVLTVATFAKLCISMSFASAYVYTSEAYPTSISNSAVGFCVTAGRLGGTIAPVFLLLLPN